MLKGEFTENQEMKRPYSNEQVERLLKLRANFKKNKSVDGNTFKTSLLT
jgi:hypothetical protein